MTNFFINCPLAFQTLGRAILIDLNGFFSFYQAFKCFKVIKCFLPIPWIYAIPLNLLLMSVIAKLFSSLKLLSENCLLIILPQSDVISIDCVLFVTKVPSIISIKSTEYKFWALYLVPILFWRILTGYDWIAEKVSQRGKNRHQKEESHHFYLSGRDSQLNWCPFGLDETTVGAKTTERTTLWPCR